MLPYYVLYDVYNNLDERYKELITSTDRFFFCSNYIKMFGFYNLFSLKSNIYNLREKFENKSQKELLDFLVNYIKEHDYNENIVLLAYGLVINKTINDLTKAYLSSLVGISNDIKTNKNKQKLIKIIEINLRETFKDKSIYYKKTPSTFKANDLEMDTFTTIFKEVYKFSNTKNIILKSQENFYSYYNQNINFLFFKRMYYSFLDKHSKSKTAVRPCLTTRLFNKKVDYLNLNKRAWVNPYTNDKENTSFLEIYDQIVNEAISTIDRLNSSIFYGEKTKYVFEEKEFIVQNSKLVNPIFSKLTIFKK